VEDFKITLQTLLIITIHVLLEKNAFEVWLRSIILALKQRWWFAKPSLFHLFLYIKIVLKIKKLIIRLSLTF